MVVNLTTLQTATSFFLMAYFFVFLVLTLLLKTGRPNDCFALSIIFFVLSLFSPLSLLAFG
jgi:hypothetical protein